MVSLCFIVFLGDIMQFQNITVEPFRCPDFEEFIEFWKASYKDKVTAGIPWFDYYLDGPALPGSSLLAGVQPLSASMQAKGQALTGNEPTTVAWTAHLSPKKPKPVSEGVS